MTCLLATAALAAVCATLPDLPEPAAIPPFPHWRIRQAFIQYEIDKTIWKHETDRWGYHAKAAIGNTREYEFERNILKDRKTLYLYVQRGDFGLMVMPANKALAIRWEFD